MNTREVIYRHRDQLETQLANAVIEAEGIALQSQDPVLRTRKLLGYLDQANSLVGDWPELELKYQNEYSRIMERAIVNATSRTSDGLPEFVKAAELAIKMLMEHQEK